MVWILIAVAGALGAACRYVLDHAVTARTTSELPFGTALVNVTGSLAAGIVAGLAVRQPVPTDIELAIVGGFLGAYTTFSTAMYETLRLWEERRPWAAVGNLVLPLLAAITAASLGWWITT